MRNIYDIYESVFDDDDVMISNVKDRVVYQDMEDHTKIDNACLKDIQKFIDHFELQPNKEELKYFQEYFQWVYGKDVDTKNLTYKLVKSGSNKSAEYIVKNKDDRGIWILRFIVGVSYNGVVPDKNVILHVTCPDRNSIYYNRVTGILKKLGFKPYGDYWA